MQILSISILQNNFSTNHIIYFSNTYSPRKIYLLLYFMKNYMNSKIYIEKFLKKIRKQKRYRLNKIA